MSDNGYSVWWGRNISGGAEFSQLIEAELTAASIVIVAWSSGSVTYHWVRGEAEYATNAPAETLSTLRNTSLGHASTIPI